MGTFCSVIRFENLQELKRLCHWGPIIALGVIAICSTMAMIDSVLWYWPLHTTGGSVNFIMLINWTVMILYNYFNAMFVGPGFVPLGWKPVRKRFFKIVNSNNNHIFGLVLPYLLTNNIKHSLLFPLAETKCVIRWSFRAQKIYFIPIWKYWSKLVFPKAGSLNTSAFKKKKKKERWWWVRGYKFLGNTLDHKPH